MSVIDFFSDHIFRMVFLGTTVIGLVAGALGSFAYLRKQSLISDVISHSALPGTLGAFLLAVVVFEADGRNLLTLITGSIIIGVAAVTSANWIAHNTKVRIDTAMAVTLSFFFGMGMLLMRIIANGTYTGKGGIQDYVFGNAASITYADLYTSAAIGGIAVIIMVIYFKEFALRSFDPVYCKVSGFKSTIIDGLMFCVIVIATVIGVKSVGLVLMVAFVVTPPAAARQWTKTVPSMVLLSSLIGGIASGMGAYLSINLGKVPTGPLIVLTLFAIFVFSLIFAPHRSIITTIRARQKARTGLLSDLQNDTSTNAGQATSGHGNTSTIQKEQVHA